MPNRRPQLKLIAPLASPAEAAAIVAALERFMSDTAPRIPPPTEHLDPWTRAAMLEGVARTGLGVEPDPWLNT
ncbi:MAG TPA: hypothetical protein VK691_09145 [Solirubrobacteraceae bacterium]|jgi:hypothetical protein|nr:hypothetical protein [Solirubrobacteraceae bacterium]